MKYAPCGEPGDLPDEDHVWRLARHDPDWLVWSADDGRWKLKVPSNALRFNDDLSAYWRERLENVHESGPQALTAATGQPLVFEASIASLVELGLTAEHTPHLGVLSDAPPGCCHVSFYPPEECRGKGRQAKRARLELTTDVADRMTLIEGDIGLDPPEGA